MSNLDYQFDSKRVANWKSHLTTEGFVVINNVLDSNQVQSGLASFIEQFGSATFDGFIDDPAFVYSDFVWSCRTNPEVLKIYQQLYNLESTKQLLTAIDRGTAIPNVLSADPDEAAAYWLHVDYPLLDVKLKNNENEIPPIYQSFLSFVDSGGSNRPGLRVVPRSATTANHERILRDNDDDGAEPTYWLLSQDHNDDLESEVVEVVSPAGSLTLWLSGLIHDNTTAVIDLGNSILPLARLVIYLCYAPRSWATAEELQLREKMYKRGQITTHWPVKYLSLHDDGSRRWAWRQMANRYSIISSLIPLA